MPKLKILSYSDVLSQSDEPRHLLLGNGFSIACRRDLFQYGKLFDRADFAKLERAKKVFGRIGTMNFEAVIRALRQFSSICGIYAPKALRASGRATDDADALREVLVRAIADSHPDRPHTIGSEEYRNCRAFLRGYKSINTLNYDLLLYWALMQDELGDEAIPCDDGFRKPADDPEADYVSWDSDNSKSQNIRYLHGALHLYDTGTEMKKFTWVNTGVPLVDQIRTAMLNEYYPVFVSEGTSSEKRERIRHNDYLCKMDRALIELQGALVVYGHSLDESDDHIFRDRIGLHGKTRQLFVSLYGDPKSPSNQVLIRRATRLANLRPPRRPLDVLFYDAASVRVWSDHRAINNSPPPRRAT